MPQIERVRGGDDRDLMHACAVCGQVERGQPQAKASLRLLTSPAWLHARRTGCSSVAIRNALAESGQRLRGATRMCLLFDRNVRGGVAHEDD